MEWPILFSLLFTAGIFLLGFLSLLLVAFDKMLKPLEKGQIQLKADMSKIEAKIEANMNKVEADMNKIEAKLESKMDRLFEKVEQFLSIQQKS